ncbi:hypothetical protein BLNAU_4919 [Blattamonas nauphoetae]|uniref:Uncharacterized protein n=1 Tax=Blattamonas nauphoetae TaxID=2049346 RepID=A0ABQ9Y8K5_9EUKA|nr:hypothetical protein BLNAU_4919 [Blattamonas nauphoetae]
MSLLSVGKQSEVVKVTLSIIRRLSSLSSRTIVARLFLFSSDPFPLGSKSRIFSAASFPRNSLGVLNLQHSACSVTPLFLVSSGELVFSSCRIGGDSVTDLPSTLTTLVEVSGGGRMNIVDSTFRQLHFIHPSEGTTTLDRCEGSFGREKGESVWGDDKPTGMNTSLFPYLVHREG